jgi:hypothetical protein
MVIDMNLSSLRTIEQIQTFLAGTSDVRFAAPSGELARRTFIEGVLQPLPLPPPSQGARGVLYRHMQHVCGYSRQHLDRLITQYRVDKSLRPKTRSSRTGFTRKFNEADVALLAELDTLYPDSSLADLYDPLNYAPRVAQGSSRGR